MAGGYQEYRGNSENKLFYIINDLSVGMDTQHSDDTINDNGFETILNFDQDGGNALIKRFGWGKSDILSEILSYIPKVGEYPYSTTPPITYLSRPNDRQPFLSNQNIVYMKLLDNDNNCFDKLMEFNSLEDYMLQYGEQENRFRLLMITTYLTYGETNLAYFIECKFKTPVFDEEGKLKIEDSIDVSCTYRPMPSFIFNGRLKNIETIEYYDKIYFTSNIEDGYHRNGLIELDRKVNTRTPEEPFKIYNPSTDNAYKPNALEVARVGFNVLCREPLKAVEYNGITTLSIQGMYITTMDDIPVLGYIPNNGVFELRILHTGNPENVKIGFKSGNNEYKEGEEEDFTVTLNSDKTSSNQMVYDVVFKSIPSEEVEIKIQFLDENGEDKISPYYDYYELKELNKDIKPVEPINVCDYGIFEMNNRAVYYKEDTIWFSELNQYDYIPNYNYITVPIEPTDKITKITYFRGNHIIFTKNKIFKLAGTFGSDDFSLEPINETIGCIAPDTVVQVDNTLFFLSGNGLYYLTSSSYYASTTYNVNELDNNVKNLTIGCEIYDEKLGEIIKYSGISEYACAIRYKNKYILFDNADFNEDDTYMHYLGYDALVYNIDLKSFTVYNYKYKPTFLWQYSNSKLLTYCSFAEDEEIKDEDIVLEYDLKNLTSGIIEDLSGNGNNGSAPSSAVNSVLGVKLRGEDSQITFPKMQMPLGNDFTIREDIIVGDTDEVQRLFYTVNSDTITFDENKQFSGGLGLATEFGYNIDITYKLKPDTSYYLSTGKSRAELYDMYVTYTYEDQVKNAKIEEFVMTGKYGEILRLDNLDMTGPSGSTPAKGIGGIYTQIDNGLLLNDTITISLVVCYDKEVIVTEEKLVAHSGSGNSSASTTDYYGSRVRYAYTQDTSKMTSTVKAYVQGAHLKTGDTTQGTVSWSLSIAGSVVNNGSKSNFVARDTFTSSKYIDFKSGSKTIATNDKPISCTVSGYWKIAGTSGAGGLGNKSVTFTIPAIRVQEKVTDYETVESTIANTEEVELTDVITGGKQSLELLYDKANEKIKLDISSNDIHENYEVVLEEPLVGKNRIELVKVDNYYSVIVNNMTMLFNIDESELPLFSTLMENTYVGGNGFTDFALSYLSIKDNTNDQDIHLYKCNEGKGSFITDSVIKEGTNLVTENAGTIIGGYWLVDKQLNLKPDEYVTIAGRYGILAKHKFTNGFAIESRFRLGNRFTGGTIISLSREGKNAIEIKKLESVDKLVFSSKGEYNYEIKVVADNCDIINEHDWKFEIRLTEDGKNYIMSITRDGEVLAEATYKKNGVEDLTRTTNYIGISYGGSATLDIIMKDLKITTYATLGTLGTYEPCIFEAYKAFTDFGQDIDIELETKGVNLKYPMHIKKLKNIFIKGLGGFSYQEFLFELRNDGYLVNDPVKYEVYVNSNGEVVYTYNTEKYLTFDEYISSLGTFRLDNTRLGEALYQTKKLVLPAKGKNFSIKIKGSSNQNLTVESIGFVFKLGKVKQG